MLAAALHACLQLHTLDLETEQYVSSLEVASAETAGDAGLGTRVGDEASSTTQDGPAAQTLVPNYMDESDLSQYVVAEVQVYTPSMSTEIADASVSPAEEDDEYTYGGYNESNSHQNSDRNRGRTHTVERSMDL